MAVPTVAGTTNVAMDDVEVVSSYNCIAADSRTIIVSGMPAKWLGRTDTPQIEPDCGTRMLDYNAGQWPLGTWEPGIRAVLHLHPKYDFTKLDLMTDRHQLACLLELVFKKGDKIEKTHEGDDRSETFRFGAQVLGSTVVFVRAHPVTILNVDEFRGFSDGFKSSYLEYPEDVKESMSHHRVITSRLGDLRIMLRYHAEGHVPGTDVTPNNMLANTKSIDAAQQSHANITIKSGV